MVYRWPFKNLNILNKELCRLRYNFYETRKRINKKHIYNSYWEI